MFKGLELNLVTHLNKVSFTLRLLDLFYTVVISRRLIIQMLSCPAFDYFLLKLMCS